MLTLTCTPTRGDRRSVRHGANASNEKNLKGLICRGSANFVCPRQVILCASMPHSGSEDRQTIILPFSTRSPKIPAFPRKTK